MRLPAGNRGAGALTVTVTSDIANTVEEHNADGTAEANNATALAFNAELAPSADLVASGLTTTPASGFAARSSVTFAWTTANAGTLATPSGGWTETISVRNVSTGATINLATFRETGGALAAGASRTRSLSITWPSGVDSTGVFDFTVTVDSADEVTEFNPDGTGESNDTTVLRVVSAPDLQVGGLQITQAQAQAGGALTFTWNDRNAGNAGLPSGYQDRITIYNVTTNEILLDTTIQQTAFSGAQAARTFSTQLPDGLRGTGQIRISVTADQDTNGQGAIVEAASGINAEANNGASITVPSIARPYPSLVAANLQAPTTGRGGDTIALHWSVTNNGQAATGTQTWTDAVVLSKDGIIGNGDDIVVARFQHTGALAIGGHYTQDQTVTLPLRLDGAYKLAIVADIDGAVIEPDNNGANIALGTITLDGASGGSVEPEAVSAPTSARSGTPIDVAWRVRNVGDSATDAGAGGWVDKVVLALGDTPGSNDIVLGTLVHTAALAAGGTYTGASPLRSPIALLEPTRFW